MSANKNFENHYQRLHRLATYSQLYSFTGAEISDEGYPMCVYCGDPATGRDHVPPLTQVEEYRRLGLEKEAYLLVPCCKSCNSFGGNNLQASIFERIEFIKDRISRKFARYLKQTEWDEEEIEELGHNLASKVREGTVKRRMAIARIEYYGGYDYLMDEIDGHFH